MKNDQHSSDRPWIEKIERVPAITLYCSQGNTNRGIYSIANDDGTFSDAVVIAGTALVRHPTSEFFFLSRRSDKKPGWILGKTSTKFHGLVRELLEPAEKVQMILADGNIRVWTSDPGTLMGTTSISFWDWIRKSIREYVEGWILLLRNLGTALVRTLIGAAAVLVIALTVGGAMMLLGESSGDTSEFVLGLCCSVVGIGLAVLIPTALVMAVLFGDHRPRGLAIVTQQRILLMTFGRQVARRRVVSDRSMSLPKPSKLELASNTLGVFPLNYVLSEITSLQIREALHSNTIAFDITVRCLLTLKDPRAHRRVFALGNSDDEEKAAVARKAIEEMRRR